MSYQSAKKAYGWPAPWKKPQRFAGSLSATQSHPFGMVQTCSNHVVNVDSIHIIYIYINFDIFLTNYQNCSLRSVFLRGSLWTVSWPYRQATQTMASRCANETQVSGSEDLKELCSALEGEIAQAEEAGDMVPIPKLTTKNISYKTRRLKDVKHNSESQVPTGFKNKLT